MLIKFEVKAELPIIVLFMLNLDWCKQFSDVISCKCRFAKDTHDFNNRSTKFKVMFNNTNEAVSDDCHMDLYPDCILGFAPESLDLKMLLDPLEETIQPATYIYKAMRCPLP